MINRKCPSCEDGRLGLKLGRNGGFIGCSNYPDCGYTTTLRIVTGNEDEDEVFTGPKELGSDPATQLLCPCAKDLDLCSTRRSRKRFKGKTEAPVVAARDDAIRNRPGLGAYAPVSATPSRSASRKRRYHCGRRRAVWALPKGWRPVR